MELSRQRAPQPVDPAAGRQTGRLPAGPIDMAVILGLFAFAAWVLPTFGHAAQEAALMLLGTAGALWVVGSIYRQRVPLAELGVRLDNFAVALGVMLLPLVAVCAGLVISGLLAPPPPQRASELALTFLLYIPWAAFQQMLVVAVFWWSLRCWLGLEPQTRTRNGMIANWRLAAMTAGVFGFVHAPNVSLMLPTFVAELVWLLLFARYRNFFALALAHAAGGALTSYYLRETSWLSSMRVGLRFLEG